MRRRQTTQAPPIRNLAFFWFGRYSNFTVAAPKADRARNGRRHTCSAHSYPVQLTNPRHCTKRVTAMTYRVRTVTAINLRWVMSSSPTTGHAAESPFVDSKATAPSSWFSSRASRGNHPLPSVDAAADRGARLTTVAGQCRRELPCTDGNLRTIGRTDNVPDAARVGRLPTSRQSLWGAVGHVASRAVAPRPTSGLPPRRGRRALHAREPLQPASTGDQEGRERHNVAADRRKAGPTATSTADGRQAPRL